MNKMEVLIPFSKRERMLCIVLQDNGLSTLVIAVPRFRSKNFLGTGGMCHKEPLKKSFLTTQHLSHLAHSSRSEI